MNSVIGLTAAQMKGLYRFYSYKENNCSLPICPVCVAFFWKSVMYIKTIWAYSDLKRKTTHTCPRRNYLSVSSFKVLKYRDIFKPRN